MADYWSNFSFMVEKKDVGEEVIRDINAALSAMSNAYLDEDSPSNYNLPAYMNAEELQKLINDGGFGIDYKMEGDDLWIHDTDGYANQELLQEIIQSVLKYYDSKFVVGYEWSATCSKPRTDAYGGGVRLISAKEVRCFTTYEWFSVTRERMLESMFNEQEEGRCPECKHVGLKYGSLDYDPDKPGLWCYKWTCPECKKKGSEWFHAIFTKHTVEDK